MTNTRFSPGDVVCNCRLKQLSGVGSYGEVWLAEDAVGAHVALKIIPNHGAISERELAGLKNYRDCNHPNLLKVRYVEITTDYLFYLMDAADNLNKDGDGEYLPDSLANRLQKYGRLDGSEVVAMVNGLLDGLEELHKKGLVHRDIKPDNILWVEGRPTLADAGLITVSGQGSLVGTIGFLSPRLINGNGGAEASDDFFALGKVIYCAVTGNPVSEYPSLPKDATISLNIHLGHAYREACKHPVKTASEFRKLLVENPRGAFWKRFFLGFAAAVVVLGVAGGAFHYFHAKMKRRVEYVLPAVPPVTTAYSEYLKDIGSTLQYFGYDAPKNQFIRLLVRYTPIPKAELIHSVLDGVADTRIVADGSPCFVKSNIDIPARRTATQQMVAASHYINYCGAVFSLGFARNLPPEQYPLNRFRSIPPKFPKDKKHNEVELKVAALLNQHYVEMSPKKIQAAIQKYRNPIMELERQELKEKKDIQDQVHELQVKAMKEEPVLSYIALDYLIHLTINHALFEQKLTAQDEADLCRLMQLQATIK